MIFNSETRWESALLVAGASLSTLKLPPSVRFAQVETWTHLQVYKFKKKIDVYLLARPGRGGGNLSKKITPNCGRVSYTLALPVPACSCLWCLCLFVVLVVLVFSVIYTTE